MIPDVQDILDGTNIIEVAPWYARVVHGDFPESFLDAVVVNMRGRTLLDQTVGYETMALAVPTAIDIGRPEWASTLEEAKAHYLEHVLDGVEPEYFSLED